MAMVLCRYSGVTKVRIAWVCLMNLRIGWRRGGRRTGLAIFVCTGEGNKVLLCFYFRVGGGMRE